MTTALLASTLEAACARWRDRAAVTCGGTTLTYGDLEERVRRLAGAWRALGVGPGDRVVCQLPNGIEHLAVLHATWACGAVHVGADKDLTAPELAALVHRTEPTVVVYQPPPDEPDPAAAPRAARAAHPPTRTVVHCGPVDDGAHLPLGDLVAAPLDAAHRPVASAAPGEPALLLPTSGTTGTPKLVVESLAALRAKMAFFAGAFRPEPDDVHLMYLPMAHAFGLKLALTALASGGHLVLMPRFSPDEALELVGERSVTILPGTPTHFTLLLRRLDARRRLGLRWAISAAAPFPPAVLEEVYARISADVMFVYGCSEGFVVLSTDAETIRRGSVGSAVFSGAEPVGPTGALAVVDIDTGARLGPGATGEVVFGTSRPVRYWGDGDVATDGWYHTGDLGRTDGEGRLYVTGRLKDVVNRGGLKVAAGEVEAALLRHPGVRECAVVPAPDPVLGEAICACVVSVAGAAPRLGDLRSFLAPVLARHKLPDELCVLHELPRSKVGKLDRRALAARVAGGQPRERLRD